MSLAPDLIKFRHPDLGGSPTAPARVTDRVPERGTLRVGASADLSILERVDGPVEFVDTHNNKRSGRQDLKPAGTIVAGVILADRSSRRSACVDNL